MNLTMSVDDAQVVAALQQLSARVSNLSAPMREIGATIKESTRLTFRDQRDPWGNPWKPLSPITIANRRTGKGKGSPKILIDTGRLRNSINAQHDKWSASVGSAGVEYAPKHQFGVRVPARPFLPMRRSGVDLPPTWRDDILEIIVDHLSLG